MDFNKFKTSDWLIVGGGLLFLIGGFLDWITAEVEGTDLGGSGGNAFDFFFTGIVPWILIIGAAVITVLLRGGKLKAGTTPWPMILLVATGVGAVLVLIRFLAPGLGEDVPDEVDLGRGIGLILCTLAGIIATAGAAMAFKEAGGSMADLTDRDKLRSQFNRPGDGATPGQMPPPPPPGSTPPPPAP